MRQFKKVHIYALLTTFASIFVLIFLFSNSQNIKTCGKRSKIYIKVKENENILAIKTYDQSISIYLGEKQIYKNRPSENSFFEQRITGKWDFVELSSLSESKNLKILCDNFEKTSIEIITTSSRKRAFLYILKKDFIWLLSTAMILGICIILYMVCIISRKAKRKEKVYIFEVIIFLVGILFILESEMLQFMVTWEKPYKIIYYEIMMIIGIPILLYIKEDIVLKDKKIIIGICMFLIGLSFFVNNLLCIKGKVYLSETVVVSKIVLIILLFFFWRLKEVNVKFILCAVGIFFTDIILIYMKLFVEREVLLKMEVLLFIVFISLTKFFEIKKVVTIGEKVDEWEKLAHQDVLTGTYNRAAYEEYIEDIVENRTESDNIAIISCDINNLKKINDKFGHSKGDSYLVKCISAIKDVVDENANIYRTGGDEFVIIINPYETGQLIKYAARFEKILRDADTTQLNDISFAYGYAYYKHQVDKDIVDTIKRADKNMYEKKIGMKMFKEENCE